MCLFCRHQTGGLRPAGPPNAVARGGPKAPLRSGGRARGAPEDPAYWTTIVQTAPTRQCVWMIVVSCRAGTIWIRAVPAVAGGW